MIPSTKVVPMSLLKYKTKEVDCSSRQQKYNSSTTGVLQKLTLVLLMFMATGCTSVAEQQSCTDVRVVPAPEFQCTYTNPWHMVCSRKRVYKTVCARWA